MTGDLILRDVVDDDLAVFFEYQLDPEANRMAAFSARDPADRADFMAKWTRILADESTPIQTIVLDGRVAGHVFCWTDEALGRPEVSYWIGKDFWGQGIATRALAMFLDRVSERPLLGRAAADNVASLRVLEKCGFTRCGRTKGFANARGEEIEEVILELHAG